MSKLVAILGTSSSAGKSTLVLLICRLLHRLGINVVPFKPQNMSLNSTSTQRGEEIAYAQYLQAKVCNIEPFALINPVLLKPLGEYRSEVIVLGRPLKLTSPSSYYNLTTGILREIIEISIRNLLNRFDVVIMEGAGSAFEPNLAARDIANMFPLLYCIKNKIELDIIIVADIYRGGAYTSLLGTYYSLPRKLQKHVRGFILNKFCGDEKLLENANKWLESRTGKPVLGVLKLDDNLNLMPEDSLNVCNIVPEKYNIDVAVIAYPYMANFNELFFLKYIDSVSVRYVRTPSELGEPDIIVLPGSRNVFKSLQYVKKLEFDKKLHKLAGSCIIVGICGGFQILSREIEDATGLETGSATYARGLGFLDTRFVYTQEKVIARTCAITLGCSFCSEGILVRGYEIHRGVQVDSRRYLFKIVERNRVRLKLFEGAVNERLLVFGTSIHEVLLNTKFLQELLRNVGKNIPEIDPFEMFVHACDLAVNKIRRCVSLEWLI